MGKLSHSAKFIHKLFFYMTKISIAAPAYNEEKNIKNCISDWEKAFKSEDIEDYEIVICNDCSKDQTKTIVEQLSKENDKISLINHLKK